MSSSSLKIEMDNRLKSELHPLENVEILSKIFSFCSGKDLKNYRVMGSRLWLKASLSSWREKAVFVINSEKRLQDLQNIWNDPEDPHQLRKKPFTNFKFHGFHHSDEKHPELSWVIDKFSEHIRHLTFDCYEFSSKKSFMDTIFLRTPNLLELKLQSHISFKKSGNEATPEVYPVHRKLRSLIIEMEKYSSGIFPYNFSPQELLRNIKDLSELRFISPSDGWTAKRDEVKSIMRAVANVRREDESKCRLKTLEIFAVSLTGNGFTEERDTLAFASMPLERFTGNVDNVIYLKPYSETLKYLRTSFTSEPSEENGEKVKLPQLTELHVDGFPSAVVKNLNKIEAENLDVLSLTLFSIGQSRNRGLNSTESFKIKLVNPSFKNVTRLEVINPTGSSANFVVDLKDFKHLSESMPNVKHAKMPVTKKAFRELCRKWPNLLTLNIPDRFGRFTQIDDETITGVKPGSDSKNTEEGRPSNITDLKLLTDFEYCGALGAHSVNHGFLHLPRLHSLNVKFRNISEEVKSALQEKVRVLEF